MGGDPKHSLQRNARPETLIAMRPSSADSEGPVRSAVSLTSLVPSDSEIVSRVRDGELSLFEILMRRYNQLVYRAVRAVVKVEDEVEDVMQQAYINAFAHLGQFEGRSRFSTWLTRIALNEAFARRRRMVAEQTASGDPNPELVDSMTSAQPDPERTAYAGELRRLLEAAVDALPETYRVVFTLRDIEGMSTNETGDVLGLGEEAVKTRLHRARAMIREAVTERIGVEAAGAFVFHAPRCDRVVAAVLARLQADRSVI